MNLFVCCTSMCLLHHPCAKLPSLHYSYTVWECRIVAPSTKTLTLTHTPLGVMCVGRAQSAFVLSAVDDGNTSEPPRCRGAGCVSFIVVCGIPFAGQNERPAIGHHTVWVTFGYSISNEEMTMLVSTKRGPRAYTVRGDGRSDGRMHRWGIWVLASGTNV